MKNKKKVLLSSMLTIVLCLSLVAGATFAMFTDESEVSIAVTGGKIDLEARIVPSTLTAYSSKWNRETDEYIEYGKTNINGVADFYAAAGLPTGGKATATATQVTIDKMAPLDRITFDIDVVNKSDIQAVYRIYILKDDTTPDYDLAQHLEVTFEHDEPEEDGYSYIGDASAWTELAPATDANGDAVETVHVNVLFPESGKPGDERGDLAREERKGDNLYQEAKCTLTFVVEAYQAYAKLDEEGYDMGVRTWLVANQTGLTNVAKICNSGDTIKLQSNFDATFETTRTLSGLTFVGADLSKFTVNAPNAEVTIQNNVTNLDIKAIKNGTAIIDGNVGTLKLTKGKAKIGTGSVENFASDPQNTMTATFVIPAEKTVEILNVGGAGETVILNAGEVGTIESETTGTANIKNNGSVTTIESKSGTANIENNGTVSTIKSEAGTANIDNQGTINKIVASENAETAIVGSGKINDVEAPENADITFNGEEASGLEVDQDTGLLKNGDDYFINNVDDLIAFRDKVNSGKSFSGKTVKLTSNIDLAGIEWTPIGRNGNRFYGTFDGRNHTIKNLTSVLDSTSATMYGNGLFGDITGGAVLKNFVVDHANVYDVVEGKGNVYGIVCGYAYGTVTFENITVQNSEVSAFGKVGAILGMAADGGGTTTIKNCKVLDTEITGAYNCATFAGLTQNAVVMSGNSQSNVSFNYSVRYGAESYTDVDTTSASGDSVCGKYWMSEDDYYMAAWADLYNELKESTINDGAIGIDALVHGVTRTVTPVEGQTIEAALKSAIIAAKDGDTVKLSSDIAMGAASLNINKEITLDFGSYKLTSANTSYPPVALTINAPDKTVTLKGTTGGIQPNAGTGCVCVKNGNLVIESGEYVTTNAAVVTDDYGTKTLTVNGGKLTALRSSDYGRLIYGFAGDVTINGGELYIKNTDQANYMYLIEMDGTGYTCTINGGTITVDGFGPRSNPYAYVVCGGTDINVNINGGNVINANAQGSYVRLVSNNSATVVIKDINYQSVASAYGCIADAKSLTIEGGTFNMSPTSLGYGFVITGQSGPEKITAIEGKISGGTFTFHPGAFYRGSKLEKNYDEVIAEGYKAVNNGNGTWTVVAD